MQKRGELAWHPAASAPPIGRLNAGIWRRCPAAARGDQNGRFVLSASVETLPTRSGRWVLWWKRGERAARSEVGWPLPRAAVALSVAARKVV
jgi:hypothetical protein